MNAIRHDDESTWPPGLLEALQRQIEDLKSGPKLHPRIAERLADLLDERCVVLGYHATRLHDDEIADITEGRGLLPLTRELVTEKIARRAKTGDFSADIAQRLSANHLANTHRLFKTYFVTNRSALRREAGMYALLNHWGGEAIYRPHPDTSLGDRIASIGTPCILEASLAVNRPELLNRLIGFFCENRDIETNFHAEWVAIITSPIPPGRVRAIRYGTAEFEQLTTSQTWRKGLTVVAR